MECDIRIQGGTLLPMTPDFSVVENGGVAILEGNIIAAGRMDEIEAFETDTLIDASGHIILPGLINSHTHLPMSMFRGLADDLPLDVWLNEHIFPAEASRVNPENVKKWAAHSCREMLLGGITACCDGYFLEDETAKAVSASGMRAVLGQGVIDFPAPGVPDPAMNVQHAIDTAREIAAISPLIKPSIFCHSPYTCSSQTLKSAKAAAAELGCLFQIHAAETKNEPGMIQEIEGRSVIRYLADLGLLDEMTLLVHAVWIDEEDIRIIKDFGAGVAHCPESNMKLASGVAPVPGLIAAGVNVGLGTDGCASNNDHDLFGEMDTAAKLHKVFCMDPCVMDARTTLASATSRAAAAIGLGGVTGMLAPGKRADVILVNATRHHMVPVHDPYSAIVYAARPDDVTLVMVDGQVLVRDGSLIENFF